MEQAVVRTVTVLVIACPHALGLAIPLVISLPTSVAARTGILVKGRLALERRRTIDAVLFDKTGTLTTGHHAVTDLVSAGVTTMMLALAAAVEADSEHPLAVPVVNHAQDAGIAFAAASRFQSLPARGVEANVDGVVVAVGGPTLLRNWRPLPGPVVESAARWRVRGAAVTYVIRDRSVSGALALEDQIRPEAFEATAIIRPCRPLSAPSSARVGPVRSGGS